MEILTKISIMEIPKLYIETMSPNLSRVERLQLTERNLKAEIDFENVSNIKLVDFVSENSLRFLKILNLKSYSFLYIDVEK